MDFSRLEKSIMDVIKEEQAKLGYRKEKIRLYYPLSSLNHFFQVEGDVTGMLEKLNWFPEYTKQRLGQVEVTNEGERFCFHIPEEGVEYVHEQMKGREFIQDLVELVHLLRGILVLVLQIVQTTLQNLEQDLRRQSLLALRDVSAKVVQIDAANVVRKTVVQTLALAVQLVH